MKKHFALILVIAVLSAAFALGIAGFCEYLFNRNTIKPMSEAEICQLFSENSPELERCAELLYSKPDFWRKLDDSRTRSWSLNHTKFDEVVYSEYFDEEEWSKIKGVLKTLNPIEVAYYISLRDHDTAYIVFSFMSSESTQEDTRSISLVYIPAHGLSETEKQEIIDDKAFRQVRTIRLDDNWYCRIDEGIDKTAIKQGLDEYYGEAAQQAE